MLPPRLQEWSLSPCIAEETNKKDLELVRKEQLEVRDILKELDKRHKVRINCIENFIYACIQTNYL